MVTWNQVEAQGVNNPMMNSRLVLVDGITGSGKSTTAQFLYQQFQENGYYAKWYHEEEPGHPLTSRLDVENLQGEAQVHEFLRETPLLWRQFADKLMADDKVHIIESYLLQDTARVLFQNNVERDLIRQLIQELLEIVSALNPALVYFWQQDVEASLRRIWARRGERWAHWCIETDANAPYSRSKPGDDEARAIALWKEYQEFANQLVRELRIPTLCVENAAGEWEQYNQKITEFLGLGLSTGLVVNNIAAYCGTYSGQVAGRALTCTVRHDGKRIYLDNNFLWPEMWLRPGGLEELVVESLPLSLRFLLDSEGNVTAVRLDGRSRWNGCVLSRV